MSLINISNLTFSYEGSFHNIFENVSFQIDTDWKLGFTGRNGRGKTTFLKLLMGKYEYSGTISSNVSFEYFPYDVPDADFFVIDVIHEISPNAQDWEIARELSLLNVSDDLLYRSYSTLSKGEQTKALLAALFLKENSFLLIDEPTNHLDTLGRKTLSDYLKRKHGFILVSHDRVFLDNCIDHILVINKTNIEVQRGNFSSWWRNKEMQDSFERAENEKHKKEISRLTAAAQKTSGWSDRVEKSKNGSTNSGSKMISLFKRRKAYMIYSKYEVMKRCISGMNFPDYRYEQLIKMIFAQHIPDFHSMYMLPERLRSNLAETFGTSVCGLVPVTHRASGQADKVLFQLKDGNCVETVNLHYKKGWESFCVSSQCGCGFGCKFCATGAIGHKRNMTADEITDQILYFYLAGHQINSVSFMGMGEPFANPNLFDALKILTNPSLFGLSQRRITISTIGMIPGIKRLTRDFPQVNLAFSLHSPFEKQRSELMPINQTYPLHKVMDALDAHVANTKRRLFLAYIMLGGINDSAEHAKALAHLILSRGALSYLYHVDLIPYNATDKTARKFTASNHEAIKNFSDILHSNRISVGIRMQFGSDIGAGCGQLYADERD